MMETGSNLGPPLYEHSPKFQKFHFLLLLEIGSLVEDYDGDRIEPGTPAVRTPACAMQVSVRTPWPLPRLLTVTAVTCTAIRFAD